MRIQHLKDLELLPAVQWLWQEYIPQQSLVTLFGPPGCKKSFLAQGLCMSVALGEQYLGYETQKGAVLYVATEAVVGLPSRVRALKEFHGLDSLEMIPFYWTQDFYDLLDKQQVVDLCQAVPEKPSLVIIDTLSRSLRGSDENDAGQMNKAINSLEIIRHHFQAAVVVVHHTAKHAPIERGSTVLRGACDTMLSLQPGPQGLLLEVSKQRDWEPVPTRQIYWRKIGESLVLVTERPEDLLQSDRALLQRLPEEFTAQEAANLWHRSEASTRKLLKRFAEAGCILKRGERFKLQRDAEVVAAQ